MATSRSIDESGWIAGAFVFSGRSDPRWPIALAVAEELRAIWESLVPTTERASPPVLGYRGCFVRDPEGRTWTAYRALVTLSSETRRDDERRFERIVLASAPEGTLPPAVVAEE
jgi:hypothetical protein